MPLIRLTRPRAVIAAALAALSISAAQASTINYTTLGTFAVASLNTGGVLVTGSNTVNVLNSNGLGVVGGAFDHTVDGAEYLEFSFAGLGSAIDLSYSVSSAGNLNGDGFVGMRTLSVFGVGGGLLGSFSQNYVGSFDVSALVGNAPIDHIRLQADVDTFRTSSITFTAQAISQQVPAPATPALMLAALAAGALLRRRRPAPTA